MATSTLQAPLSYRRSHRKRLQAGRRTGNPVSLLAGNFFAPAVGAPFQKVLQCHGVAGFTTRRLRARAGAEQGISNDRNRELSGDFGADQGKNRRAKTGRQTGRGRVARRGQDSLPPRVEGGSGERSDQRAPRGTPGSTALPEAGRERFQRRRLVAEGACGRSPLERHRRNRQSASLRIRPGFFAAPSSTSKYRRYHRAMAA